MKILITGAGGLIGGYLADSLCMDGHEIIATYRNTKPQILNCSSRIRLVRLDLSEGLQGLEPVDVIIHAAAHTHLIPNSTAYDYIQTNMIATLNLAYYSGVIQPRVFIYLSTLSVYGEIMVSELDEDTPLNKPEMYGLSKYMGELILREYADQFPTVCIRLPGVVGKGYFTPWLGKTVVKASRNEPIWMYNPDSMFNNVVDLVELHRFICHISRSPFAGFDAVNLAASEPIKIREVIGLIISLMGSKSEIFEQDTRKQSFSIKTEKIRQVFGFVPATTKAIIHRYVVENIPILDHWRIEG